MTRVLFLAESFHPVLGGGETHVRRLGEALVRDGHAATVITRRGERDWPRREELSGIAVRRVAPSGPGRVGKYAMIPAALAALRQEARHHDVLVVRGTRVLGAPGLLAGRWCGLPVVLQPEINGELDGQAYTWGRSWGGGPLGRLVRAAAAVRNLWLRDADAFVAMSLRIRDEMLAAGIAPERIALIPHGVDVERFRPAREDEARAQRARLGLPDGVLLVYTGRLLRGKGLESLLEAFAMLASQRADLHLVLVGSGEGQSLSVEDALRQRAAAGVLAGRVTFTGRVERVEDWLRAADLFVFPSEFEALGISLVEAAACGLPAVGARTGGIVDVIEDGCSGLLVPPADDAALFSAMARLCDDGGLRRQMGDRARAVALARFDEQRSLACYHGLFAELASRRRGSLRSGGAPRAGAGPPPSPAARA